MLFSEKQFAALLVAAATGVTGSSVELEKHTMGNGCCCTGMEGVRPFSLNMRKENLVRVTLPRMTDRVDRRLAMWMRLTGSSDSLPRGAEMKKGFCCLLLQGI